MTPESTFAHTRGENSVTEEHRGRRPLRVFAFRAVAPLLFLVGALALHACSYLEALGHPRGQADDRAQLGATDALSVLPKEVPHYVCEEPLLLTCEKGGGLTYYCHCVLY